MNIAQTKFHIGPVSKNIVDTIIEVNNDVPNAFGFIPLDDK